MTSRSGYRELGLGMATWAAFPEFVSVSGVWSCAGLVGGNLGIRVGMTSWGKYGESQDVFG